MVAERSSAKLLLILVLVGLGLCLSGSWILPLMDRDEPRFAEASREMLQRHDLLIPWFNGKYRFDKPPLIYWCQIACYKCFGQNTFAARFPGALFTVATAVALLFWGRRLGNEKAGFYAGLMFITCLQSLIHGRLAVADMPMIFFFSLAVWSGWEMTRPTPARKLRWWCVFYLSMGLGFLAKGPVAWLPLVGLLLGYWIRPADFKLSAWKTGVGMLVCSIVVAIWAVPALLATGGQFFTVGIGHHVIFRSFAVMEGHGGPGWKGYILTLPAYLPGFFFSFFPWAFAVPVLLRKWWPTRVQDSLGCYLLLQGLVVFVVFTIVRTKLPHYTLPAFAAIALWLSLQISARPVCLKWIAAVAFGMWVLAALITTVGFKMAQPYFVAASLWQQVQRFCPPETEVATIEFNEPSLVWEFRKGATNYLQELKLEEARVFLKKPGPRILIMPTREVSGELGNFVTNGIRFRSAGIDTARFRRIDLMAIVKP